MVPDSLPEALPEALPNALPDALLDLLLGSACAGCGRPGRVLCADCFAMLPVGARLSMPTPSPQGLVDVWAAAPYDGLIRSLVLAHKERRRIALARPLGEVLASAVATAVPIGSVVLVPVPSSPWVVRARGHDPVLRMTRAAAGSLRRAGRSARVDRLLRVVRRPADQSGLTATARMANLAGVFAARTRAFPGAGAHHLVVVDDVVTTGATLREAQRALARVGEELRACVTLAATVRTGLPRSQPEV